ncbi:MAG: hypothetical protein ABR865_00110 [Terracidiphilus sp.]
MLFTGRPAVSAISPMKTGEETRWRQRVSAAKNAWIWIHGAIMREEGEMIGKVREGFFGNNILDTQDKLRYAVVS